MATKSTAGKSKTAPKPGEPQLTPFQKYAPLVGILAALAVMFYACGIANTGDPSNLADRYDQVERVFPSPESEVLRQASVGLDVAPGYAAVLHLNGVRIPEDQVNVLGNPDFDGEEAEQFDQLESINRYQYQPLEGRAVEALNPDRNCMRAEVFPVDDIGSITNIEWCFTAA